MFSLQPNKTPVISPLNRDGVHGSACVLRAVWVRRVYIFLVSMSVSFELGLWWSFVSTRLCDVQLCVFVISNKVRSSLCVSLRGRGKSNAHKERESNIWALVFVLFFSFVNREDNLIGILLRLLFSIHKLSKEL